MKCKVWSCHMVAAFFNCQCIQFRYSKYLLEFRQQVVELCSLKKLLCLCILRDFGFQNLNCILFYQRFRGFVYGYIQNTTICQACLTWLYRSHQCLLLSDTINTNNDSEVETVSHQCLWLTMVCTVLQKGSKYDIFGKYDWSQNQQLR